MYEETDDSIRSLFVHYRWIKYNQNAAVGKHCVLDVGLNDTVSWAKNKLFLEQTFPYMATREETNELEMINMQVPIDLSLAISFKLNLPKRYNRKNKYDGWGKGELAEIKSITNMIRSSYLYDDINSILKKHKLTIDNVRVTELTLAFLENQGHAVSSNDMPLLLYSSFTIFQSKTPLPSSSSSMPKPTTSRLSALNGARYWRS